MLITSVSAAWAPPENFLLQTTYDFIIVGGGPARCAVACALVQSAQDSGRSSPSALIIERGLSDKKVPSTFTGNTWPQVTTDTNATEAIQFKSGVWGAVANILGGGSSANEGLYIEETPDVFLGHFGIDERGLDMIYKASESIALQLATPSDNSLHGHLYVTALNETGHAVGQPKYAKGRANGTWLMWSTFNVSTPWKQDRVYPCCPASALVHPLINQGLISLTENISVERVLWNRSTVTPCAWASVSATSAPTQPSMCMYNQL